MPGLTSLAIVQEWIAAINAHDGGRLAATLDDDFVWELGESSTTGRDASKESWELWFTAFPDLHFEVLQAIVDDDHVASRMVMTGTHMGELRFRGTGSMSQPIAPTDRRISVPSCAFHKISNGKILHLWAYWDTATLMRQLGLLPAQN